MKQAADTGRLPPAAGRRALAGLLALAAFALCGCIEVTEHLTLNADGSGTLKMTTSPRGLPPSQLQMINMISQQGEMAEAIYPPLDPRAAEALFEGEGLEVQTRRESEGGVAVDVAFKDINALLRTPYARAHSLDMAREDGELIVRLRTGVQALAYLSDVASNETAAMGIDLPGLVAARKEAACTLKVTLPADVTSEQAEAAGSTATWTMDASAAETPETELARLDSIIELRCSDASLSFKPDSPPRLDLGSIDDAPIGEVKAAPEAPSEDEIREAARFVPAMLKIVRSFNLAGEDFWGENGATLTAVVVLPERLKPQRFGEARLIEAVDDQDLNLVPRDDDGASRWHHRSYGWGGEQHGGSRVSDGRVVHTVEFSLRPPDFEARKLALLTGAIDLRYAGREEVVLMRAAVAESAIKDHGNEPGAIMGGFFMNDDSGIPLAAGLKLGGAGRAFGLTMINLVGDQDAAIVRGIQVFDFNGKAFPTSFNLGEQRGGQIGVVVFGRPEPPLSIVAWVEQPGARIELPIELKNVPVSPEGQ